MLSQLFKESATNEENTIVKLMIEIIDKVSLSDSKSATSFVGWYTRRILLFDSSIDIVFQCVFVYIQVSGPLALELDAKQWNEFVHHALR